MLLRISFSQQRKRSEGAVKMHRLKPERDGRAALLAFIAALDASVRSLRRDGCGDHTNQRASFGPRCDQIAANCPR